MTRSLRITVFAVLGVVGLLVVGTALLLLTVGTDGYKARLESAASRALQMEVRVGGRMGLAFFPDLLVTLEDVRIRNRGTEVASAAQARLAIDSCRCSGTKSRSRRSRCSSPGSSSNGIGKVSSTSRRRRSPRKRCLPWTGRTSSSRTRRSSTPTGGPGTPLMLHIANSTCVGCDLRAEHARPCCTPFRSPPGSPARKSEATASPCPT